MLEVFKSVINDKRGVLVTFVVGAIGLTCLLLSGAKVGQIAYEKHQTDAIADQFQEQAQYLGKKASDLGKSGDLAVIESLRLNEASKKIRNQGLQIYSEKMVDTAVDMGKGLALGKVIEAAGTTGKVVNVLRDLKDIGEEGVTAYTYSEADKQIWETIKGSRDNIDDFELAQRKAELDKIAKMKSNLQQASNELKELFRRYEEAQKWEARQKEQAEIRAQARLEALKDDEIKEQFVLILLDPVFEDEIEDEDEKIKEESLSVSLSDKNPAVGKVVSINITVPPNMTPPFKVDSRYTGASFAGIFASSYDTHSFSGDFVGSAPGKVSGKFTVVDSDGVRASASINFEVLGNVTINASGRWSGSDGYVTQSGSVSFSFPAQGGTLEGTYSGTGNKMGFQFGGSFTGNFTGCWGGTMSGTFRGWYSYIDHEGERQSHQSGGNWSGSLRNDGTISATFGGGSSGGVTASYSTSAMARACGPLESNNE